MRRAFTHLLLLGCSVSGLASMGAKSVAAVERRSSTPPPASISDAGDETDEGVAPAAYRTATRARGGQPTPADAPAPAIQEQVIMDDSACLDGCCEPEATMVPTRLWVGADYLMWWVEGFQTPALVTCTPLGGDGALDSPNAVVVAGDDRSAGEIRSGARFKGWYWLGEEQNWAVGGDFWFLENKSRREAFVTDNDTLYWRPFKNTDPDVFDEDAQLGDEIEYRRRSRVYSAGAHLRRYICGCCETSCCGSSGYRLDALVGFRYLALDEGLSVHEQAEFGPVRFNLNDRFTTHNDFYGAEIGLLGEYEDGPWVFTGLMRTALGSVNHLVSIQGNSSQVPAAPFPDPTPGGLLAQVTNIGTTNTSDFAVLTELGASVGYQITSRLRTTFGYTFLYLSNVARPGDQVDRQVDGRFLNPNEPFPFDPPAMNPMRRLATTDVWIQGMSFGVEFDY